MSSYLSFERLKKVIEERYVAKRKKIYAPKDPNKKVITENFLSRYFVNF